MDWTTGQVTPFAFKKTGDEDFPTHIKALLLGAPKSGKTTFLSTFPNIVVADVEAGLMSIAHKNIPYVTIDKIEKLQTLLFVLRDESMRAKAAEQMGLDKIESVGIDTMDALQVMFKKERLATERRTIFEMKDWGWLLDQFRELIAGFVALPMHVVLTVHTKTVHVDEERTVTHPGLQGAIAEEIAGMVGFSMMTHRSKEVDPQTGQPYTQYRLQVEGDDSNPHLGNRAMGRLGGYIEPRFDVLHAAIFDGLQLNKQTTGEVNVDATDAGPKVEEQATEAVAAQAQAPAPAPAPANPSQGTPPATDDQVVNAAAMQHLERFFGEFGFRVPPAAKTWTMGFAREVAAMFVSTKEDLAEGKTTQDEATQFLTEFLMSQDAWVDPNSIPPDGTIDEVMEWVGDDPAKAAAALAAEKEGKDRATLKKKLEPMTGDEVPAAPAQPAPEASAPAPTPAPEDTSTPPPAAEAPAPAPQEAAQPQGQESAPAPEPTPVPAATTEAPAEATSDQADALITEELGGVKIDEQPANGDGRPSKAELLRIEDLTEAPVSSQSGQPIDDLDIAKLSLSRFGEWLRVDEYIAKTNASKG